MIIIYSSFKFIKAGIFSIYYFTGVSDKEMFGGMQRIFSLAAQSMPPVMKIIKMVY